MTEYIHMPCREWEEKLMSTDLEHLSDQEMDAVSQYLAKIGRKLTTRERTHNSNPIHSIYKNTSPNI